MMRAACGVILLLLGVPHICTAQLCGQSYDNRIAHIHTSAQHLDGSRPRLVLTGSSSIRKCPKPTLSSPKYDVVNAGFGGSCFSDLWALRDTLIYALRPEVLVIYEGDNDLSDGVPQRTFSTTPTGCWRSCPEVAGTDCGHCPVAVAPDTSSAYLA